MEEGIDGGGAGERGRAAAQIGSERGERLPPKAQAQTEVLARGTNGARLDETDAF